MIPCLLGVYFVILNKFAFEMDFPSWIVKGLTAFPNFAKIDLSDEKEK